MYEPDGRETIVSYLKDKSVYQISVDDETYATMINEKYDILAERPNVRPPPEAWPPSRELESSDG